MQIRRAGRQPHQQFAMVPNESARDARLSFRARGILTYLLSHDEGWRITVVAVAREGREGRAATAAAFRELEAAGYIRRLRYNDERGRIARVIDLYPYGDATDVISEDASEDDDEDDQQPEPGNQSPENRSLVNQSQVPWSAYRTPVTEDQPENVDSPVAAAPTTTGPVASKVPVQDTGSSDSVSDDTTHLPMVLRRKLQDMGVTDGVAWEAAWTTALGLQWPAFAATEASRFPEEHLMLHLMAQQEQHRDPTASRWMRFYIEDRQRRIDIIAGQIESVARAQETPQEREDRINRRLPPDWSASQPVKTEAAVTTGEQA